MNMFRLFPRFVRRLPDYFIATKHLYLRSELNLPVNVCIFDDRRFFYTPDSLNIHDLWVHHCTSYYTRNEVREWLKFSDGCRSLLDAGSSAGFFSGIFNRTTEGAGNILSVEPDIQSFRLLQETIRLNKGGNNWRSTNCALSGKEGHLTFYPSDFGGDLGGVGTSRPNIYRGDEKESDEFPPELVRVETLESLCKGQGFVPDLIKMDIESYEYETLTAATAFLEKFRPKLFLELHNEKIRGRGLNPETLMDSLRRVGYRCIGSNKPAALFSPPTVHLCIVPS
jgi:FkbM family methyltransferase